MTGPVWTADAPKEGWPPLPRKASELDVERIDVMEARAFVASHHSRLPSTQRGPWKYAYGASEPDTRRLFAVGLWHNPSARMLPQEWLELRRMAVSPDAPHCTASFFLQYMVRDLRKLGWRHFISYQDTAVHAGTIYKASGWQVEHVGQWRDRKRGFDRGRGRNYRTSINGSSADQSAKARWGICYGCDAPRCVAA